MGLMPWNGPVFVRRIVLKGIFMFVLFNFTLDFAVAALCVYSLLKRAIDAPIKYLCIFYVLGSIINLVSFLSAKFLGNNHPIISIENLSEILFFPVIFSYWFDSDFMKKSLNAIFFGLFIFWFLSKITMIDMGLVITVSSFIFSVYSLLSIAYNKDSECVKPYYMMIRAILFIYFFCSAISFYYNFFELLYCAQSITSLFLLFPLWNLYHIYDLKNV